MNRPIKFRAWFKGDETFKKPEMLIVTEISWLNGTLFGHDIDPIMQFHGTRYLKDCVLMQFTGLLDRHGKEIWEGDVVRNEYVENKPVIEPVVWELCGFWLPKSQCWPQQGDLNIYVEVLGNIYENQELLK